MSTFEIQASILIKTRIWIKSIAVCPSEFLVSTLHFRVECSSICAKLKLAVLETAFRLNTRSEAAKLGDTVKTSHAAFAPSSIIEYAECSPKAYCIIAF